MLIAVDVDDTVADLVTAWLGIYNSEHGDNLSKDAITNWAIGSFTKIGEEFYRYLDRPGFYGLVPAIDGAVEGINTLRELGHRVVFVTAYDNGKLGWLNEHGFQVPKNDYAACSDKSLIRADVMIDDGAHNLRSFVGKRILFTQPWNLNEFVSGAWRACNWVEIPQMIQDIEEENDGL